MSQPVENQNELPAAVGSSAESTLSAVEILAKLHDVSAGVREDIAEVRKQSVLPVQIIPLPGGKSNDFLARTSGPSRQRFYIYRNGRPVEIGSRGEDVIDTYNLVLKQLTPEEEADFRAMSEELDTKKNELETLVVLEGRKSEAEATRVRIEELERGIALIKPILPRKRAEIEEGIMKIPVGTRLFMSVQNASDLYPVVVVEDRQGMKCVETMYEETPNGLVNGGYHPRGFQFPLRNRLSDGSLYLQVGTRTGRAAKAPSNSDPIL